MKAYNYTHKLVTALLLLSAVPLLAQTVNTGGLYVMPNTQFSTVGNFDNTASGSFINDGVTTVLGNFNNNGIVDFTPGDAGVTKFQGTNVQKITGGNTSYFYDVLFNNNASSTASFELAGAISIDNEANFKRGIVQNDTHGGTITFENNANHVGVYDGSHVDGKVEKVGDDSFMYPVGDKQFYRYAAISAPDTANDQFTAKYFFDNPVGQTVNGQSPTAMAAGVITLVDNAEFWTLTRDAGNSDVLLTLSWEEGTTTPAAIAAAPQSAIHIVRWDTTQMMWVDEGGVVDAPNKTVTTPLKLDNYGIFTLARVNEGLILPGNVVVYNGITPNGDGVNDYFLIDNIQNLANNTVQVFNRWGVKVFETDNYDTSGNVFNGYSNGRLTVGDGTLPTGTYYYVIGYDFTANGNTSRVKKAGYLYITTED